MSKKGVTRGLDKLGRVVIPMSMRKLLNIGSDDTLEVHTEGNKIILEKYKMIYQQVKLIHQKRY